ncbi:efflux RND transporter periplasmic adaptor subunit [Luteolibacter pohnpeiensis]|uniref:Efflux RND transporter periplasmic adaptor subunit n=1 Tax=Luteolibacter pohnpeiensis TaxID=454153 RepID=A0A934VTI5_9BACT|nr:efflux RND transporter periplasmic adaptor subunit [Luteolibacter pohnpeiensis]MBK1881527.1 efflux RND transporter periplasmic adaptor subunit [Luteolibacter pohnpeiensis]
MMKRDSLKKLFRPRILVPVGVTVVAASIWLGTAGDPTHAKSRTGGAYVEAEPGDFTIALPTGGSLEAVNEVTVRNEVPGQTRIISLIKEGSFVKKGDLLIELDSEDIENRLNQAEISYQQSVTQVAESEERVGTIESENIIRLNDTELALEFAKQNLLKYREGEWPQLRKKAESTITLATEELRRAQDRLDGTRKLEEKGYATSAELIADQLVVQRRDIELQSAREDLRLLTKFDYPQKLRQLEANEENAKIRLERTRRQNETSLEKAKMQLTSIRETQELRESNLADLKEARKHTKIYAPQSGLVVYEKAQNWRQEPIEEGSNVRERQTLISLPDVSKMQVPVNIYENQISLIKPGMKAYVHIDALPGQRFEGEVQSVATMPEPSQDSNPSNRVYKAEVVLNDSIPDIKPGVTARVEVLVAELQNVIKVPLQSVVGIEDRQFCFIHNHGKDVPVEVQLGLFDSDFVEILSGVEKGDQVVLAPPSVTSIPDDLLVRASPADNASHGQDIVAAALPDA